MIPVTDITPLCDYWIREDGPMRRCGEEATHHHRGPGGDFFYCRTHAARCQEISRGEFAPCPLNPEEEHQS